MSRRRGEFEHRTSIFEGAFRAWSHLGGLDPHDLESKTAAELDPLTNPLDPDPRLADGGSSKKKDKAGGDNKNSGDENDAGGVGKDGDGKSGDGKRREYPYEALPRSGLAHPFVQAILSPWLGPDADQDAIQLGLTTLRTWWQHRRKGESGSAIAALGTDKMRGVVEGYTRHFFNLAHCLVTNDKEQPPRTLHAKMKELEKVRTKRNKKRAREEEAGKLAALALNAGLAHGLGGSVSAIGGSVGATLSASSGSGPPGTDPASVNAAAQAAADGCCDAPGGGPSPLDDPNLTPLERLHAAQRRQLAESGGVHSSLPGAAELNGGVPVINMKGQCMPGRIDLPSVVQKVSSHATQLAHRGSAGAMPSQVGSHDPMGIGSSDVTSSNGGGGNPAPYGDPNTTPVVFVSENGDIQIAMSVEGITCAHCVKIVETVLRGCNGNKSPINGLLDAAADRVLCSVLIKIDKSSNAKRISFEAARNLAMVGYTAKSKEMSIVSLQNKMGDGGCGKMDGKAKLDLNVLSTAFEVVAATDPKDVFDWNIPCKCPDNGVLREDCPRHSQMNTRIFDAFDTREDQVTKYMAGCGKQFGMDCSCGPDCRCKDCEEHCNNKDGSEQQPTATGAGQHPQFDHNNPAAYAPLHHGLGGPQQGQMHHSLAAQAVHQHQMNQGGGVPGAANMGFPDGIGPLMNPGGGNPMMQQQQGQVARNSLASFGGGFPRHMSITSETTFGRAMSGLSALSIDWENMEDFDVNVDHSAHINNGGGGGGQGHGQPPPPGMAPGSPAKAALDKDSAEGVMAGCAMLSGGECDCGPNCVCAGCPIHDKTSQMPNFPTPNGRHQKRSSLRKNMGPIDPDQNMQVSFKV